VFNHNLLDRYIYGVVSSKKFYNNSGYKINLKKVHYVFVVVINDKVLCRPKIVLLKNRTRVLPNNMIFCRVN
jgi:antibiotic biosynthesis monooxygenase (ABM) superfamily enzyme